jgi:hypothetical protein
MITIIGYKKALNDDGEPFNMLQLQGEVEMVKSKETGRFYATARKTLISSTFDDRTCEDLIGTKMPGEIQRVSCEPYEYEIPETGEKILLEHTWEYNPEPVSTEEHVFENNNHKKAAF